MKQIIRDDLRYIVFSEVFLRFQEPKTMRKAFSIMEAAIVCYAKKGWERTTLEMIAREIGGTRAQIQHYFSNADELRNVTIRYIRLSFQRFVVDQVTKEKDPSRMLEVYIRSCFRWVERSKKHALVWLSFLHAASSSKKDQLLNTEAVQTGYERLCSLIQLGNHQSVFNCSNPQSSARAIQVLTMGAMISMASEEFGENEKAFEDLIVDQCFALAGRASGSS